MQSFLKITSLFLICLATAFCISCKEKKAKEEQKTKVTNTAPLIYRTAEQEFAERAKDATNESTENDDGYKPLTYSELPWIDAEGVLLDSVWPEAEHTAIVDSLAKAISYADEIGFWFGPVFALPNEKNNYTSDMGDNVDPNAYTSLIKYFKQNRSKINFPKLFQTYNRVITTVLPEDIFHARGYDKPFRYLEKSYSDLVADSSQEESFRKLEEIYMLMSQYEDDLYSASDTLRTYVSEQSMQFFLRHDKVSEEYQLDNRLLIWAYSFWSRRYIEGILDDSFRLLNMIKKVYSIHEIYYEDEGDEEYDGESDEDNY